jgi:hypothetical protein
VRIHDFVYGMNIHDVQNDLKVVNDGDKIELKQNKWTMSQVKMAMDEGSGRSMNWVKQHIATL